MLLHSHMTPVAGLQSSVPSVVAAEGADAAVARHLQPAWAAGPLQAASAADNVQSFQQGPAILSASHPLHGQACGPGMRNRQTRAPPGLHPAQQHSASEGRLHAQRINHFVGMMEICRKKALARNMSTMAAIFPKLYTFTPSTLSLPHCIDRALAKLKSGRETFIIKPDASSQASAPSAAQGRPGPSLRMDTSHARLPLS